MLGSVNAPKIGSTVFAAVLKNSLLDWSSSVSDFVFIFQEYFK